jgi:drug/metabolite transporter (DMT)-like permease
MVPVLQLVVLRRAPHPMSWAGVVLAFAGLILLAGPDAGTLSLSIGELLTLVGAMAIATEIILIGRYAGEVDSRRVTIIQLFAAGILAFCAMPVMGEAVPAFSWVWVASGVGLGIASAIMQLGMNWAQRTISPTRATVIYAGEPVWGGLVGRIAGDQLPSLAVAGAGLIISGVLISEWRPKILQNRLKKKSQPDPSE